MTKATFHIFAQTLSAVISSACLIIIFPVMCGALPPGQITARQAHVDLTPQATHTWKPPCQNPCQGKSSSSPDSTFSFHWWRKHRLWVGCVENVTPSLTSYLAYLTFLTFSDLTEFTSFIQPHSYHYIFGHKGGNWEFCARVRSHWESSMWLLKQLTWAWTWCHLVAKCFAYNLTCWSQTILLLQF